MAPAPCRAPNALGRRKCAKVRESARKCAGQQDGHNKKAARRGLGVRQLTLSGFLDFLEHLEDALRRAVEEALVALAETTPLERVAAGAGTFCHVLVPDFRPRKGPGSP